MPTRISSWTRSGGTDGASAPVEDEVSWLRHVIEQRRGSTEELLRDTVARNVRAAIDAGTTFLADTTTAGLSWDLVAEAPCCAVVFAE